jgi:hypothetical protein
MTGRERTASDAMPEEVETRVKDSHYISRSLLRNWERLPGDLRFYDFRTGKIGRRSAKHFYSSPTPFPSHVEIWLSDTIEAPVGEYLARSKLSLAKGETVRPEPSRSEWKAIAFALLVQSGRTVLGRGDKNSMVSATAEKHPAFLDQLFEACHEQFEILLAYSSAERLFFPSLGVAPVPLAGTLGAWLLPLTPELYAALVPRTALPGAFDFVERHVGFASALSVGLKGDRVVLPPTTRQADHAEIASHVRFCRENSRKIIELYARLNALMDLGRKGPFPLNGA